MDLRPKEIRAALLPFGVELTDRQTLQVALYVKTLLFWNQRINLTAVTQPSEILARHFGESMFGAQFLQRTNGTLADVGSGAGFPGLPLKILAPTLHVTLIEPVAKKAVFLSEIIRLLELSRVHVLRARTEELLGVAADCVTARAVGDFHHLLEWSRKALTGDGQLLLWLGRSDAETARSASGWQWSDLISVPGSKDRAILSGIVPH